MRIPVFAVGVLLLLVLTACSGSDDGADAPTTTAQQSAGGSESTTSTVETDSDQDDDSTTSTAVSGDSGSLSSGHPRTDVSHATVVVGDEVFLFAQVDENGQLDQNGVCDPTFLGVQFKAILHQIDDQGGLVVAEDTGDLVGYQTATFGFTDVGPEEGIVALSPMWQAATAFGGGSVDTVAIDGNTVTGTATFVSLGDDDFGENATEGSFELVCVG